MLDAKPAAWIESGKGNLSDGHKLNQPEILFPKIEDEIIERQMEKLVSTNDEQTVPVKEAEKISYEDFMKTQLKVAEILEAERIEKSEKLLKLKVKIGTEERQVIAGIAKSYSPEEIKGRKVIIVANLKPAKLMGQLSEGMILAAENKEGKLEVLTVPDLVETGTRVK
jgi:methionyl-tRNA synthetase